MENANDGMWMRGKLTDGEMVQGVVAGKTLRSK